MLTQFVPTVYWYQPQQNGTELHQPIHHGALMSGGFNVKVVTKASELYQAATEALTLFRAHHPSLFLISGKSNEALSALSRLRSLHAHLPILVEIPEFNEADILHLLYCGADHYCLQNTSPDFWIATLSCLLRRARLPEMSAGQTIVAPEPRANVEQTWVLVDKGWVLMSPEGKSLTLTTTERQLIKALCTSADKRASHELLLEAISNGDESIDLEVAHNRLGVVISRLKRKAQKSQIDNLPIRSVYKWGYMFGAAIRIE